MKRIRFAILTASVVLAVFLAYSNAADSRFSLYSAPKDMYVSPEAQSVFYSAADAGAITDGATGYRGAVLESYQFDLQPGKYDFTLYATGGVNGYFELYSPIYTAEDGSAGRVFASEGIRSGSTAMSYSAGDIIRGARLRVVYGGGALTVFRTAGSSRGFVFWDSFALFALTVIAGAVIVLFLGKKKNPLESDADGAAGTALVLLAAVIATLPICRFSLPYAHDILFHMARIEGVYESLKSGQFPVRMGATFMNGLGYADQTMYPPLFVYFPAALRLLRVSPVVSYQLFILAINTATALVSKYAFTKLTKSRDAGTAASLAYTLAAFRLICVLTRAAVGELLGMVFLPLVLLGMYELLFAEKPRIRHLVLGFTGIVNSHLVTLDVACILSAVFVVANLGRLLEKRRLRTLLLAAGITLLLNAWVIFPVVSLSLSGLRVTASLYNSGEDAVYPFEMFATFLRADGLSENLHQSATAMPLSVGGIFGLGALLFIVTGIHERRARRAELASAPPEPESGLPAQSGDTPERESVATESAPPEAAAQSGEPPAAERALTPEPAPPEMLTRDEKLGRRLLTVAALSLFIASTLFPWNLVRKIPGLGGLLCAVQFPWRYFGAASAALAVVLALALTRALGKLTALMRTFVCFTVIALAAAPYIDMYMQNKNIGTDLQDKFSQVTTTYFGGGEYVREGTDFAALRARGTAVVKSDDTAAVSDFTKLYGDVGFTADIAGGEWVEVPLYWYPGFTAYADGAELATESGEFGAVRITLPETAGRYGVTLGWRAPPSYRAAEAVSLLTAASLAAVILIRKKRFGAIPQK
ncbi:MAG: hypothetical protein LBS90_08915 [Oscillospiraceae bacterium]|jgi:hypothetical protein|nr:hypothetical protein [Oscillospiraceae bacterium]